MVRVVGGPLHGEIKLAIGGARREAAGSGSEGAGVVEIAIAGRAASLAATALAFLWALRRL